MRFLLENTPLIKNYSIQSYIWDPSGSNKETLKECEFHFPVLLKTIFFLVTVFIHKLLFINKLLLFIHKLLQLYCAKNSLHAGGWMVEKKPEFVMKSPS